ncbi:MAG: alpha-amylase family glycosyl hydrolase, partial [Rhabdochlamydiaceae bacterium]
MKSDRFEASRHSIDLGAIYSNQCTTFRVWAPYAKSVDVLLICGRRNVDSKTFLMNKEGRGYFSLSLDVNRGTNYYYIMDGEKKRPDPASRWQPNGIHRASAVVDSNSFSWQDASWNGVQKRNLIIYELHVGTFTKSGTFVSIIPHLGYLKEDLGVTAIEIMPVGQFPGDRNWGYDGVFMYAPQNSYGGPDGLRKLVNACHANGIGVLLDVVYNHLGPEGNYLGDYGPYFSFKYKT